MASLNPIFVEVTGPVNFGSHQKKTLAFFLSALVLCRHVTRNKYFHLLGASRPPGGEGTGRSSWTNGELRFTFPLIYLSLWIIFVLVEVIFYSAERKRVTGMSLAIPE